MDFFAAMDENEIRKIVQEHEGDQKAMQEAINAYAKDFYAKLQARRDNPQTVDDYLLLAHEAKSRTQKMKYLKKAAWLDPQNLDAKRMMIEHSNDTNEKTYAKLKELLDKATDEAKEKGWFEKYMGQFYIVEETRPYIRLMSAFAYALVKMSRYGMAVKIFERIMVLNENDNTGARFVLMHLYAHFEELDKAEALHARESSVSPMSDLPLAILYYKLCDYEKARKVIDTLKSRTYGLERFLDLLEEGDIYSLADRYKGMQNPGTFGDYVVTYLEHEFLYKDNTSFLRWVRQAEFGKKK